MFNNQNATDMTKQEFQQRVKMNVTDNEYYDIIEPMYMRSDVDKDEFCAIWRKMNRKRIAAYKIELQAQQEAAARIERLWKTERKLFLATRWISAENLLDEQELADLHAVNISTHRMGHLNGHDIKIPCSANKVWYELHEYLMSA